MRLRRNDPVSSDIFDEHGQLDDAVERGGESPEPEATGSEEEQGPKTTERVDAPAGAEPVQRKTRDVGATVATIARRVPRVALASGGAMVLALCALVVSISGRASSAPPVATAPATVTVPTPGTPPGSQTDQRRGAFGEERAPSGRSRQRSDRRRRVARQGAEHPRASRRAARRRARAAAVVPAVRSAPAVARSWAPTASGSWGSSGGWPGGASGSGPSVVSSPAGNREFSIER